MGDNTAKLVGGALVLLALLVVVPMVTTGGWMMGTGHMGPWGGNFPVWMAIVGAVMQLLVVLAVGVGIYVLYRAVSRGAGGDEALDELRLAYARGDLSEEEYEQRRQRLEEESS